MKELLEKIKRIEALIEGSKTEGEKNAAILAKSRVNKRLVEEEKMQVEEYTLYTPGTWHKRLLLAICRKYGVRPYRYKRQKYTTVMVMANANFVNDVIWKEYLEYSGHLEKLVEEITDSIIKKIHQGDEEEDIIHGKLSS